MTKADFKVLLVDDDEDDYIMIRDMIADLPGKAIKLGWIPTFKEAKEAIARHEHDAYLVDYRLGAQTGLDLLTDADISRQPMAPLILLTGYGDHEIDLKAMESGAADYLVKDHLTGPLLERTIRYAVNRAEIMKTLTEREESVRSLFDAAFEGIIVHDKRGEILDVNRTAAAILGHSPDELIGTNQCRHFDEDACKVMLGASGAATPVVIKTVCTRLDGTNVHIEVASKAYSYRGKPAILTACRDISERVRMEAQILQQDRLASIGLLASSLAHEIGTPLGVIRGRAEFLTMQGESSPATLKSVDIIISQIDRVSKLIRSLLTLARGEPSSSVVSVDVRQVISGVIDLLGYEFEKRQILFLNEVPEEAQVMAEAGSMHQVLLNLLVNSLHAIESAMKGGRTSGHRLRISAVKDDSGYWILSVEDTGCGISPTHLKQLFRPFFTTKEIGVGTGLGLATSYRLVEAWGGTIQAKSTEGQGTVFEIRLRAEGSRSPAHGA